MRKKSIYKMVGAALVVLYIVLVCIFANSEAIKANKFFEVFLPFVLAFCLIGGVIFIILGFKKDKITDANLEIYEFEEIAEKIAQNIIAKTEKIKKLALLLLGVGIVFAFIGYFLNEIITKIGAALWIVGVFIGIFSRESKKYKIAKNYLERIEKDNSETLKSIIKESETSNNNIDYTGKNVAEQNNIIKKANQTQKADETTAEAKEFFSRTEDKIVFVLPFCNIEPSCLEKQGLTYETKLYPILAISDFLIENDYEFCKARTFGGVDEASHLGVMAYKVEYTNISKLKNDFESDYKKAEKEICNGYIGELEYTGIKAEFKLGDVDFYIAVEEQAITLRWENISQAMPDYELIINKLKEIKSEVDLNPKGSKNTS